MQESCLSGMFLSIKSYKISAFFLSLDLGDLEPNTFLSPFLGVIRSEDTTGPITGLALTSVNKFISYGLIGKSLFLFHFDFKFLKLFVPNLIYHSVKDNCFWSSSHLQGNKCCSPRKADSRKTPAIENQVPKTIILWTMCHCSRPY